MDNQVEKNVESSNKEDFTEEECEEEEADDSSDDDMNTVYEWKFKQLIGKGSQSSVYLVVNTQTNQVGAAKVYQRSTLLRRSFEIETPLYISVVNEIKLMASLSHRYVLPLKEVVDDDVTKTLILFMPYAKYGDLQSYVDDNPGKISENMFSVFFYDIAEAMKFIHSKDVVHRDLKPENVLVLSEERCVLADFSVSATLESPDQKFNDSKGPPAYLAPEELNGDEYYPKPADVWSFGVAMYKCLFGYFPFNIDKGKGQSAASTIVLVTNLVNKEELIIPNNNYDPHAIELIQSTLQKDPSKRPTFEQILTNPWFDHSRSIDEKIIKEFEEEQKKKNEKSSTTNSENK
ncbi:hypothetical protein M9Y10_009831 [Tritrichomonas musculus]|uniref:Protein kinase domain-containing protein n=1 Tax=Tritrichomonas musculus TaxID=1915356 RepID=A0ABR2IPI2_9EUKA